MEPISRLLLYITNVLKRSYWTIGKEGIDYIVVILVDSMLLVALTSSPIPPFTGETQHDQTIKAMPLFEHCTVINETQRRNANEER